MTIATELRSKLAWFSPTGCIDTAVGREFKARSDGGLPPSAVNLKFLSLLAASSFKNFKFKTALES
jgi:hypothetical protein